MTTQCRSFAYFIPNSLVLFCRFFDANNDQCFVISRSIHQWLDNPYLVKLTFDSRNVNALSFQIHVFWSLRCLNIYLLLAKNDFMLIQKIEKTWTTLSLEGNSAMNANMKIVRIAMVIVMPFSSNTNFRFLQSHRIVSLV